MSETAWILSALVTFIILLIGIVMADHHRRMTDLETHVEEHDRWAGAKSGEGFERIAALEANLRMIMQRFDRLDGQLERISNRLERNGRP